MAFKISENTVIDNNENIISSGGASFQQDVTLGSGVGGPSIKLSPDGTATFAGISTFSSNIVIEGNATFADDVAVDTGMIIGANAQPRVTINKAYGITVRPISLVNGGAATDLLWTGYSNDNSTVTSKIEANGSATFSGSVYADNFIGSISGTTGNFSGDVTISGNLGMTGSIVPSLDNTYDLGSPTKMWRDVYIGPGSLYVNGQKIVEADDADNIILSASAGQNLVLKPTGLGDLELAPEGGIVQVKAALQIQDGTNITNSAGNAVSFSNNISAPSALVNEITSRSTDGDLVLSGSGSGIVRISDSLNVVGSVDASSVKVNGVPVNTSTQVDSKISTAINAIPDVDLSNYDTSSEVDTKISTAVNAIPATDLSSYDTSTQVDSKISTAINAIPDVDLSGYDTSAEVTAKVNALETSLTAGAPGALDTLNELAASLGDDANFASTMTNALATKADSSSLANVATSGSYTDLSNKPSIPTHTSHLTNNSGFITSADGGNADTLDGLQADHFIYRDSLDGYYKPDTWIDFGPRGATSGLYWSTGGAAGWHIYPQSTSSFFIRSGNSGAVQLNLNTNGTTRGYVYANSADTVGFLAKDGSWRFGAPGPQGNSLLRDNTHTIWDSGNDGSGSGLDADKLDGQEGSYYLNYNNLSNKPSIVSPTGSGASGTWGINITGSANSANTATDADKVDGIHASSFLRLDQDNTITKSLLSFDTNQSDWGFRFQNSGGTNNYVYMTHGAYGMHVRNDSSTTNQYLLDVYPSNGNRFQIRGGDGLVTSGGNVMWHAGNDGSGSGLDADLLDGSQSTSFFKSYGSQASGWQNSSANFKVRSGTNSSGLTMSGASGEFGFQLYGNGGGYYGFLDAEWAGWDIQKQVNGAFLVDEGSGLKRVWNEGNDGSGSGLDADLLDGLHSSSFLRSDANTATTGQLVIGGNYSNNPYNSVSSTRLLFGGGNDPNNYYIGTNLENYGGTYTKLDLRWHTGIRMGAQPSYGGVRIFNNEDLNTLLFSVGRGDGNTRVESGDLYIRGNMTWHAGNDGSGSGLDADLLDGMQPTTNTTNNTIVQRDGAGNIRGKYLIAGTGDGDTTGWIRARNQSDANMTPTSYVVQSSGWYYHQSQSRMKELLEVSTNGVSSSAPSSPNTGDFWTDTSSDPPILKSWNGSSWIEVGSAGGASGGAPVINGLSLSEDNTSGARFTDKDFTATATMLEEGSPVSQKGIKATITANFDTPITTDGLISNSVTNNPIATTSFSTQQWGMGPASNSVYMIPTFSESRGCGWYSLSVGSSSYLRFHPAGSLIGGTFNNGTNLGAESNQSGHSTVAEAINGRNGVYWMSPTLTGYNKHVYWWNDVTGNFNRFAGTSGTYATLAWDGGMLYSFEATSTSLYSYHLRFVDLDAANATMTSSQTLSYSYNYPVNFYAAGSTNSLNYGYAVYDEPSNRMIFGCYDATLGTGPVRYANVNLNTTGNSRIGTLQNGGNGPELYFSSVQDCGSLGAFARQGHKLYHWETDQWVLKWAGSGADGYLTKAVHNNGGALYGHMHTSSNNYYPVRSFDYGQTWQRYGPDYSTNGSPNQFVSEFGLDFAPIYNGSSYGNAPYRELVTQAATTTSSSIASWSEGESICLATDPLNEEFFGTITNINYSTGTFDIRSSTAYSVGAQIQSRNRTESGTATRYLIINSIGEVSGHIAADPGFVTQGPGTSNTIRFPATFPTGNAPDVELPAGTALRVEIEATNSEGTDTYLSNSIIPT